MIEKEEEMIMRRADWRKQIDEDQVDSETQEDENVKRLKKC